MQGAQRAVSPQRRMHLRSDTRRIDRMLNQKAKYEQARLEQANNANNANNAINAINAAVMPPLGL